MKKFLYLLLVLFLSIGNMLRAQDRLPVPAIKLYNGLYDRLQEKTAATLKKLQTQTTHYLEKIEKEELKLKNKLAKKHPDFSSHVFENFPKIEAMDLPKGNPVSTYLPLLDSIQTSLQFLKLSQELPSGLQENLKELQSALEYKDALQKQLAAREAALIKIFESYGLSKQLKTFRKQVYYYRQQLSAIKDVINEPSKVETQLLSFLRSDPGFIEFFSQHSQLSKLFVLPGAGDFTRAGLQTRSAMEKQMIDKLGSQKGLNHLHKEIQLAQGNLQTLKNKISSLASGGVENREPEIKNFQPNSQKTKSFLNRLELGSNFQSVRARQFFPVTTDIGLSLGYRLNDKSIIGLGISYRIGWGRGWDQIAISHQGAGLRSFIDWKIKTNLFISGGYEQNHLASFRHIAELKNTSYWQPSGLLGLAKKYSVSKKFNGEIKLLWDFLSYSQQPVSQPLIFRLGYQLK